MHIYLEELSKALTNRIKSEMSVLDEYIIMENPIMPYSSEDGDFLTAKSYLSGVRLNINHTPHDIGHFEESLILDGGGVIGEIAGEILTHLASYQEDTGKVIAFRQIIARYDDEENFVFFKFRGDLEHDPISYDIAIDPNEVLKRI